MAQAGTMLIGGDAADALGDSLYEAVIYVAGTIASLGSDARIEELTESDVRPSRRWPTRPASATSSRERHPGGIGPQLYNFDALKDQKY